MLWSTAFRFPRHMWMKEEKFPSEPISGHPMTVPGKNSVLWASVSIVTSGVLGLLDLWLFIVTVGFSEWSEWSLSALKETNKQIKKAYRLQNSFTVWQVRTKLICNQGRMARGRQGRHGGTLLGHTPLRERERDGWFTSDMNNLSMAWAWASHSTSSVCLYTVINFEWSFTQNEWIDIYCKWEKAYSAIKHIQKDDMDLLLRISINCSPKSDWKKLKNLRPHRGY